MSQAIEGLKPELLWKHFAAFSRIPRCSKNEAAASRFVVDAAKRLGLEHKQDSFGNVVVKKPASPGREAVPSVCLQGHLDMVCEKNADKVHDFSKDPIELVRRDHVLMANGTTLGADNGVAVATNLAIMEDRSIEHGPLEFLFTVDEETGLTGANNLGTDFLESRTLLNLDSEEEGALYVGCSGGKDTTGTWKIECDPATATLTPIEVKVSGLRGGHSGLDIDKGRGNAIKVLNRVLMALDEIGARVSRIDGGSKRNAIPREAKALVFVPKRRAEEAAALVGQWNDILRAEVSTVEPDLSVTAGGTKVRSGKVMKKKHQRQILATLSGLPHGVIKMSADIPGLVETSTNLAVVVTARNSVTVSTSQRSSVASEILEIARTVRSVFELGGAEVNQGSGYPGWKPNIESPVLKLARATYADLYGREPEVKAVHAGLECGIIGEKYPGMDMVSLGPTLEAVHSPDEKIYVDTVGKYWDYLLAILKNFK
jgi:dipeptidase D